MMEALLLTEKPFYRLDLIQGSDEWKRVRFDYVSASNVSALFGVNPYKTALEYAEELVSGVEKDQSLGKEIVFHQGHIAEGAGRDWVETNFGIQLEPVVVVSTKIPCLLASLDGHHEESSTIFENKYVGRAVLEDVKNGILKQDHLIQVQTQLLVTGASKAIYFAIDPDENAAWCEVYPDLELHEKIAENVTVFYANLKAGILPAPCDRDALEVVDPRFETLKNLHEAMNLATKAYESLETELLEEFKYPRIKAGPVSITRTFTRGNIDYKAIPELKGVDLERYRKQGSFRTRVSFKKEAV
jgi:putative phage-type endonuclease